MTRDPGRAVGVIVVVGLLALFLTAEAAPTVPTMLAGWTLETAAAGILIWAVAFRQT